MIEYQKSKPISKHKLIEQIDFGFHLVIIKQMWNSQKYNSKELPRHLIGSSQLIAQVLRSFRQK